MDKSIKWRGDIYIYNLYVSIGVLVSNGFVICLLINGAWNKPFVSENFLSSDLMNILSIHARGCVGEAIKLFGGMTQNAFSR